MTETHYETLARVDRNVCLCAGCRYPDAKIFTTYEDFVADFAQPIAAPDEALSLFERLFEMPAAERLAGNGLIYSQFNTRAWRPM